MTTTIEVSETLERVDSIVNMLDEICDHMDGFSSTEEAWLSSITEPCALGAMSCRRPTKARKKIKMTSSFLLLGRPRRGRAEMKAARARLYLRHRCLEAATG